MLVMTQFRQNDFTRVIGRKKLELTRVMGVNLSTLVKEKSTRLNPDEKCYFLFRVENYRQID